MSAKVIAEQIYDRGIYLIDIGNDQGRVADTNRGIIFSPTNRESIIARGHWKEVFGVDIAEVLALVKPR